MNQPDDFPPLQSPNAVYGALAGADGNAVAAPVALQKRGFAAWANQRVVRVRTGLQDRFYRVLIAGCANLVRGLAVSLVWLQRIDTRPHVGLRKKIARRLSRKAIRLLRLSFKLHNRLIESHLRLLGVYQLIEKLQNELLKHNEVGFRAGTNLLNVLAYLRGGFDETEGCPGSRHYSDNINHSTSFDEVSPQSHPERFGANVIQFRGKRDDKA